MKDAVGPAGWKDEDKLMVPANPFRLVKTIWVVAVTPSWVVTNAGDATTVKSGPVTEMESVMKWEILV